MNLGKFFKNVFTRNLGLKVIAIVLSFAAVIVIHSLAYYNAPKTEPEEEASCAVQMQL